MLTTELVGWSWNCPPLTLTQKHGKMCLQKSVSPDIFLRFGKSTKCCTHYLSIGLKNWNTTKTVIKCDFDETVHRPNPPDNISTFIWSNLYLCEGLDWALEALTSTGLANARKFLKVCHYWWFHCHIGTLYYHSSRNSFQMPRPPVENWGSSPYHLIDDVLRGIESLGRQEDMERKAPCS